MAHLSLIHVVEGEVIRMAPNERGSGVKVGIKDDSGYITQVTLPEDTARELGFGDLVELHVLVRDGE